VDQPPAAGIGVVVVLAAVLLVGGFAQGPRFGVVALLAGTGWTPVGAADA
jgi:hypothetical protein